MPERPGVHAPPWTREATATRTPQPQLEKSSHHEATKTQCSQKEIIFFFKERSEGQKERKAFMPRYPKRSCLESLRLWLLRMCLSMWNTFKAVWVILHLPLQTCPLSQPHTVPWGWPLGFIWVSLSLASCGLGQWEVSRDETWRRERPGYFFPVLPGPPTFLGPLPAASVSPGLWLQLSTRLSNTVSFLLLLFSP